MSKTPVVTSAEANFRLVVHLSNVPSIATEAFTSNLMLLSSGVIAKTGACARQSGGKRADATTQRIPNRMVPECESFAAHCQAQHSGFWSESWPRSWLLLQVHIR